jgi:2'-5' RNA ligase
MPFVRAFVAVEVSDEVRDALQALQAVLKRSHAHAAWVAPRNMHLSLLFLGDVPAAKIALLAATLDGAVRGVAPFTFTVKGTGIFGNRRAPRVVWAGVAPCAPLMALQRSVETALRGLGLQLKTQDYAPHLTLGRVRSSRGGADLVRAVEAAGTQECGAVAVSDVVLFRSCLLPEGAVHTVLHRAGLGAAPTP